MMVDAISSFQLEQARSEGRKARIASYSSDDIGNLDDLLDYGDDYSEEPFVMVSQTKYK